MHLRQPHIALWRVARQTQSVMYSRARRTPPGTVPKVNNAHDRAVRESRVAPFRLYDLRHTWSTRAAMSGIDLVTLAAMLGHSRIQMVLRYAHPTQEHQTQAMQCLERFVSEQKIAVAEQNSLAASRAIQGGESGQKSPQSLQ